MATPPLVSCIIPAYNAADTIVRAIESARRQTCPHIEVVVVDDGSTDGTESTVRARFPDVTCVRHTANRGPAAARNSGARAARGAVLAFLDADDEWLPVKTELQLDALAGLPKVGALFTGSLLVAGRWGNRIFPPRARASVGYLTCSYMLWGSRTPVPPASAMIPASTFASLGGFDERRELLEDELWVRMAGRGLQLARLELPLYVQHVTAGSVTSDARWMSDAQLATVELCAPHSPVGRGIGMSDEEYARLRRKWVIAGALSLVRAGHSGHARQRLCRELEATGRPRYLIGLLFLVAHCPSLLRTMVRAAWLPGRLLHYLRARAGYWRYAKLLEAHPTDAGRFQQEFPRARRRRPMLCAGRAFRGDAPLTLPRE